MPKRAVSMPPRSSLSGEDEESHFARDADESLTKRLVRKKNMRRSSSRSRTTRSL